MKLKAQRKFRFVRESIWDEISDHNTSCFVFYVKLAGDFVSGLSRFIHVLPQQIGFCPLRRNILPLLLLKMPNSKPMACQALSWVQIKTRPVCVWCPDEEPLHSVRSNSALLNWKIKIDPILPSSGLWFPIRQAMTSFDTRFTKFSYRRPHYRSRFHRFKYSSVKITVLNLSSGMLRWDELRCLYWRNEQAFSK